MLRKQLAIITTVMAVATTSLAGTMGSLESHSTRTPFITLSAGPAWSDPGLTQTISTFPDISKAFVAKKESRVLGEGGVFGGIQSPLNDFITGQLGLAVGFGHFAKLNGDLWEEADSNFNNYFYSYKINHIHIAVKGKLIAEMNAQVQPYISGSIGAGFNRAYSFTITPKIYQEIPALPFGDRNQTAFTYTIGAGLQKAISEHWVAGIGYEFADWGKSPLNRALDQTINNGLSLQHVYTNELQFSLTYQYA